MNKQAGLLVVLGVATGVGVVWRWAWLGATLIGLGYSLWLVVRDLRARRFGTDVLAIMSLGGTLLVGEFLAGALVALMLGTGQALEGYASRRAHRDLDELLARAPSTARVRRADVVVEVPVAEVVVGDLVVVRPGEVVAVDGRLTEPGTFDESALTGESLPVPRDRHEIVHSGVCNAGAVVTLCAVHTAADSAYAGIVRLAGAALAGTAPVARIADRFARLLVPVALVLAGAAWWWSGDAVLAVAVLVTATPCPLLLAVPAAITAGMSATSRRGVVVKDGAVLERLGRVATAILDKTGTLTVGHPRVVEVLTAPGVAARTALAWAAAVERDSPHVLATAVVAAAEGSVPVATGVTDEPGFGASGVVEGRVVRVGRLAPVGRSASAGAADEPGAGGGTSGVDPGRVMAMGRSAGAGRSVSAVAESAGGVVGDEPVAGAAGVAGVGQLPPWARAALRQARLDAVGVVWVSVDGEPVAALLVRDEPRPEAARTLARLRAAGVRKLVLVTGDRREVAEDVGRALGLDDVVAGADPAGKVARVRAEQALAPTMAVGDGINDAPALAAADVGVAVAARGATATAQVADAVLTDDGIDRLADAVETARRTRRIAVQSAGVGMGLSVLAMAAAAAGLLAPAAGALVQELIDVLAVGNALRALGRARRLPVPVRARGLIARFRGEHTDLAGARAAVRHAADTLSAGLTPAAEEAVRAAHRVLVDRVLPHERAEEHELYPAVAPMVGGPLAIAPMSRGHAEIERLVARLGRHLAEPVAPDQVNDLRATLYGLDAVLTLHFAQEEQDYFALAEHER